MMKKQEVNIVGQISDEEIRVYKESFGEVHEIIIPANDEGTEAGVCYLRKPTRKIIEAVFSLIQTNPIQAAEVMMRNCWICGDERIKNDDDMFLSAVPLVTSLIKIRTGEIKKK